MLAPPDTLRTRVCGLAPCGGPRHLSPPERNIFCTGPAKSPCPDLPPPPPVTLADFRPPILPSAAGHPVRRRERPGAPLRPDLTQGARETLSPGRAGTQPPLQAAPAGPAAGDPVRRLTRTKGQAGEPGGLGRAKAAAATLSVAPRRQRNRPSKETTAGGTTTNPFNNPPSSEPVNGGGF